MAENPARQSVLDHRQGSADKKAVFRAWRQIQSLAQTPSPSPESLDVRCPDPAGGPFSLPTDLGDYELLREIHRGGQGIVYEATQKTTDRRVAVKVLRAGLFADAAQMARFAREIRLLVQLSHPNIVTVYDSGVHAGHCYYVMDYIDGESLESYIARCKPAADDIMRLFCRICDAVNVAHMRGVIHRDLKPGNILIDRAGEPHILDFGLAKVSEYDVLADDRSEIMTQTGQFVGSIPWASPEQAQGQSQDIDIRTDVYAIGVLLYRALTGRYPYVVFGPLVEILENILTVDPARPSAVQSELNDEIDTVILKCLAKPREHRYQSAGELARDIRRYLAGDPIEAKRDSSWYLFKKSIKRHRIRAVIAGLVTLLIIHTIVGLSIVNRRESRLRAEAQSQANIANAVNDFLNRDLLSAVRPDNRGLDVTVREVLDSASQRVEGRFHRQPLVEAAVRETLGNTYMELGDWPSALIHAERVLELRRAELGNKNARTLAAMNLVARLYRRLGRLQEANSLYNEMLGPARKILGNEDELTTKGISNSAYVLSEMGRDEEAITRNTEVLNIRQRTLGPQHPDTLTSMNNQAYYLSKLGRLDEAEELYAKVLEVRRRVLGPEHPHTLISMSNLGITWARAGRLVDAERIQLERMAMVERIQGGQHPEMINSLSSLGDLYRRQKRFEQAERFLVKALDLQRRMGGDSHPRTAARMTDLGKLYSDQNRLGEAEHHLSKALAIYRATVDKQHPSVNSTLRALGICHQKQHRFAEAEPLLLEAHASIISRLGPNHEQTRAVTREIISLYDAWRKPDRSAHWRDEIARWAAERKQESTHPITSTDHDEGLASVSR